MTASKDIDRDHATPQRGQGRSKIAIVTGGGSGIGRASAVALAADGWTVVVTGRRLEPLTETIALAEATSVGTGTGDASAGTDAGNDAASHEAIVCDVTDESQVEALFAGVAERFGRIDLLFNNAGAGAAPVPFDELTLDDWRRVVDVNLTGTFLCARAAFAQMRRQEPRGGRILNNGSISAHVPRVRSAPYTATKHAVEGLTKSLALDGRDIGITCGQIDIGNAGTPMMTAATDGMPQPDGSIRPEPLMDVDDVARAVVYMASLPPDATVLTMTVMAATMPYVGRG